MKEFLSNSWVVSIISGIIVFFLTNAIIMLQNRRKHKKQISDANTMVLNRLRGYVVDNGLPPKEIINAIKASTAREHDIKFEELLCIKEICEELITDIIGNIYISNDNKIHYMDILQNYLNEDINTYDVKTKDINEFDKFPEDTQQNFVKIERTLKRKLMRELKRELIRKSSLSLGMIISTILAILSAISVFFAYIDSPDIVSNKYEIYSEFASGLIIFAFLCLLVAPATRKIIELIELLFNRKDK